MYQKLDHFVARQMEQVLGMLGEADRRALFRILERLLTSMQERPARAQATRLRR
jgi:hypothetical protein